MLHRSFFLALTSASLLALTACAVANDSGDPAVSSEQGLDTEATDDLGNGWFTLTLSGYDTQTGVISGDLGSFQVLSTTQTRHAILNQFIPVDPVLPIATAWNTALKTPGPNYFGTTTFPGDATGFAKLTTDAANLHAHMRVSLNGNGTVKSLRLVP